MLGEGLAPSLVLSLISELPDTSRTSASLRGGEAHRGWGQDRYMQAAQIDAIHLLARVAGVNWPNGKIPDIPPWPRPNDDAEGARPKQKKKPTVKDLWALFASRAG